MKRKFNYKTWAELTVAQREQVKTCKALANCSYLSKPLMKYNIDEKGNFTNEYIDAYILAGFFS